jgi:transcriptional regulator with XRE-family HTH domain
MDAQKFGAFVAECRKEKNMTQADLAVKLNVTDKAISRWERGIGFPDINTIEPLANALGISIPELMKSEKIATNEIVKEEASAIISDTLYVAKLQRRQERKNIFIITGILAAIVILILFLDNLNWKADTILFTLIGVLLPLLCVCASVVLLIYGVWRKSIGKTSKQTFRMAMLFLLVLLLISGIFVLVGTLGIGPVP